jgi:hypothetical protein
MDSENSKELIIFTEALQLPHDERRDFLDQACVGDPNLRREVEALIAAHESAADFLEQSPSPGDEDEGSHPPDREARGGR